MKTTELRTGNLLLRTEGQILTVKRIESNTEDILVEEVDSLLTFGYTANPIPLTSEWFEKFGFKKLVAFYIQIDKNKMLELGVNNDNSTLQYYVYFRNNTNDKLDDYVLLRKDLKYVHQLQNLYFALCGEELNYKK